MMRNGLCFTFALLVAGCSSTPPDAPKCYPVTGTVMHKDGSPMKGGSIQFTTETDPSIRVVGEIQVDGKFVLNTAKDKTVLKGAPEGEFRVIVMPPLGGDAVGGAPSGHKGALPIALNKLVRIEPKENELKIEVD